MHAERAVEQASTLGVTCSQHALNDMRMAHSSGHGQQRILCPRQRICSCRPGLPCSSAASLSQSPSLTAWISCSFRSGACRQLAEAAVGRGRGRQAKARRRRRRGGGSRHAAWRRQRAQATPAYLSSGLGGHARSVVAARVGCADPPRLPEAFAQEPTIKSFEYSSAQSGFLRPSGAGLQPFQCCHRACFGGKGTCGAFAARTDPCSIAS